MIISRSLLKQMIKENGITREDLWQFIQAHKDKAKDEFGGWLVGQEIRRTDKMIMAIDLWNKSVTDKVEKELEEGQEAMFGEVTFRFAGKLREWRAEER